MTIASLASSLLLVTVQASGSVKAESRQVSPSPSTFASCEAEAWKLFGDQARSNPRELSSLKRTSGRPPEYPSLPAGTRGSGTTVHELLIRPDGRVQRVWTLREPSLQPPFPPFGRAITDALQQWQYEPLIIDGHAVPVCLIITTTIHWR